MSRRALVIGAPMGLLGVEGDATRAGQALAARGFAVDQRIGPHATRAAILGGYDDLIRDARDGDAVVVFYAGHGSYVVNQDADDTAAGRWMPRSVQLIVPVDYDASTSTDFRGITSWELSLRMAALTEKTRNVTVILDCCHSSQMSRDGLAADARARALPHPLRVGVGRYLAALREQGARFDRLDPESNPHAVRLVAAGIDQVAWEYQARPGETRGAMTDALLTVLDELGDDVATWASVGSAVRERVLARFPSQRPELEGPAGRALFSLDEPAQTRSLAIAAEREGAVLRGGRLAGVGIGDVYAVTPIGDTTTAIATATVQRVTASSARCSLSWSPGHATLPPGARAIPVLRATVRRPVAISGGPAEIEVVTAALGRSTLVAVAAPGDTAPPLATIRAEAGAIAIGDRVGDVFPSVHLDDDGVARTVATVEGLAVAQQLRELEGNHGLPPSSLEIGFGVVIGGEARPLPRHGAMIACGDRWCLNVSNRSSQRLFVHVFEIGVRGLVSRMSTSAPSGVPLPPGETYVLGRTSDRRLVGIGLRWPTSIPEHEPRRSELFVIATTEAVDLAILESDQRAARSCLDRGHRRLQRLFGQLHAGGMRESETETEALGLADAFVVERASFQLHPQRAALAGLRFLVDENPTGTHAGESARAWSIASPGAPRRTRVVLEALHVGGALAAGGGALHAHALAITRAGPAASPWVAASIPLRRNANDARLRDAAVFDGIASEMIDLCLWVTTAPVALPALLAGAAGSDVIRQATTALVERDGPWIGAVGASAILARAAHDLLTAASPAGCDAIYRTSFVASEQFGAGRHPREGDYRSPDLSFAIRIELA